MIQDHCSPITVLGSTGSVGVSTLEVLRKNPGRFRVVGLTCQKNIKLLAQQIQEFRPEVVSVGEGLGGELKELLGETGSSLRILEGKQGNVDVAGYGDSEKVIAAIMGAAGLLPVMSALKNQKIVALANKEPMVLAGSLVMEEAERNGVPVLPIDSEHNAIFQALQGSRREDLDFITLTGSGGPFRTKKQEEFSQIRVEEALKHPNWEMGKKITIDSATLMNKSLEVIEAKWLFQLRLEQIQVVIHPESIVHSLVTYKDGSTLAQLGLPDMKVPIAYCLAYPSRISSGVGALNLAKQGVLHFEEPDLQKFPTLKMAYQVLELGAGAPAALNGANENLVELFLTEKIRFLDIFQTLSSMLEEVIRIRNTPAELEKYSFFQTISSIEEAILADEWGRDFVSKSFPN